MSTSKPLVIHDKIERVDYRVLVPAGYNPRRMSPARAKQLAASLLKFGFTLPILAVKKTKEIIGGHQRITRIADLVVSGALPEGQEVPVIWRDDLSKADQRKLNIALNEIDGEFTVDGMAELLREIEVLDGGTIKDLEAMGLNDDDLKALLDAVDVPQEQLQGMADEAAPRTGAKDRVVVPANAYKFSVPKDLAEQFIEPAFKAFGHDALEILGKHGGRVAKFDGPAAAIVAVCRYALKHLQAGIESAESAADAEALLEDAQAGNDPGGTDVPGEDDPATEAPARPRRVRKPTKLMCSARCAQDSADARADA